MPLNFEEDKPTGITFWVQGIVAARNGQPYVQLANGQNMLGQLTIAEARHVAFVILTVASYAEADAMLFNFFQKMNLPSAALGALMQDFRDFRHQLAMEKVDTSVSDPDTGKE